MNSKKQFDHIEEKIKQAAENNLPPFDEKAWQLMEAKLDNENKKRRPFLWWMVLPLLLAGSVWGVYEITKQQDSENIQTAARANKTVKQEQKEGVNEATGLEKEKTASPNSNKESNSQNPVAVEPGGNNPGQITAGEPQKQLLPAADAAIPDDNIPKVAEGSNVITKPGKIKGSKKGKMKARITGVKYSDNDAAVNVLPDQGLKNTKNPAPGTDNTMVDGKAGNGGINDKVVTNENDGGVTTSNVKDTAIQKPVAKKTETPAEEIKQEKKKVAKGKDNKQSGGFYVQVSAGTDAGSTRLFSYGNSSITPKYGIGVGYQFNKRFGVQTGFYASNKKYVAGKDDYAAKPDPYWQYLSKVKAACLIYEIPLTLTVNLVRKPSFTLFGTVGSSFFIMKREDYDYIYDYYGQEHVYAWEYTGNRHLFSSLNLSIGIEKKISGKFHLLAEPSFGIPLKGVGDGKVKLYSSSLQVGARYKF